MALVIYDMQVAIARQLPQIAPGIVTACAELLETARSTGYRVIFLRHMSMPKRLMGAFQLRQAMAWQRTSTPEEVEPWFLRDSPGFAIVPELTPRSDEVVLDKIGFSAFEGTPLATILRDCGLDALALCGIAMEIGIDPTARHAADLGLVPIVVRDACGSGHAEAGERSLHSLAFLGDAILTGKADLVARMEAAGLHA